MINFKINWRFHFLWWNMYSLQFVINISTSILFENVLKNQFEIEGSGSPTYGSVMSENSTKTRSTFAIGYFEQDLSRAFKINSTPCAFAFALKPKNQSDETTIYDTLTQDDKVRNQYLSLPYPSVSKRELTAEWQYYKNRQNTTPYNEFYAFTLESLNHYLYKGENNFR